MQESRTTGVVLAVMLIAGLTLCAGLAVAVDAPPAAPANPPADPAPKTEPAKPAGASATQPPAESPATPPSPFGGSQVAQRPDAISGVIELSDGARVPGDIFTTRGQDIVILDAERKTDPWRRIPPASILSIETKVEWQRMDDEWRFKTAGSPEKVYTGKSYPNRSYSYVVTLRDETRITGAIHGIPLYVRPTGGEPKLFVLHERHKGQVGTELKDLVYVKAVRFSDELRRQVEAELAAKAEADAKAKADAQAKADAEAQAKAKSEAEKAKAQEKDKG